MNVDGSLGAAMEGAGLSGGGYGGQVTAEQLHKILAAHLTLSWPPIFIWGPPGVGKSSVVRQVAAEKGLEVLDLRMLLLDPVDLRGLPMPHGDRIRWSPPEFLPQSGHGILFLDELNAAPPLVQASVYQLVLDRKVGEYALPEGWHVVAAGNRESDQSIVHAMPAALLSRFEHLEMVPDLQSWSTWAYASGIDPTVIAFLQLRPALLFAYNPDSKAFPCPRTWEMASRILALSLDDDEQARSLEGCVGAGPATELNLFRRSLQALPKLEAIVKGQDFIPGDPALGYAVVTGLVARYGATGANTARLVAYAEVLGKHGLRELEVLLVRDLLRRNPKVAKESAFAAWAKKNVDALT